jgi:NAD(P)-dependent dehydrogenase (short-subunit alcohol dehydrogenase family)
VSLHRFDALEFDKFEGFLDNLPELPRIVVCAIGVLPDQDEAARDPALARHVIDSNLTGSALILEAAGRRLAALDESTALIGISSVAGDRGRARNYVYGAAKAGFSAWLSGMHQKYAHSRLHVMTVKRNSHTGREKFATGPDSARPAKVHLDAGRSNPAGRRKA